MKQKDIALIAVAAFISAILSVVISGKIFAPPKNRHQNIETIQKISTSFPTPDSQFFNPQSVDPTQLIIIGGPPNSAPFNTSP